MNAPAELAKVIASQPDATLGYKTFTLGSFNFSPLLRLRDGRRRAPSPHR